MFTGIVRTIGELKTVEDIDDGKTMSIGFKDKEFGELLSIGSSVAISGVCLTVTDLRESEFTVDISEESLDKTNLSERVVGDLVNLEPSLRVGDEIGGHFVFGHVDSTVPVKSLELLGDFWKLVVKIPESLIPYVAKKGSVALDGISLTVNEIVNGECSIRIIPHTYQNTSIKDLEPGKNMNLEVDMLARYVYNTISNTESSEGTSYIDTAGFPDPPRGNE